MFLSCSGWQEAEMLLHGMHGGREHADLFPCVDLVLLCTESALGDVQSCFCQLGACCQWFTCSHCYG